MPKKRTIQIQAASNCFIMQKLPASVLKQLTAAELKVLLYGASGENCELALIAAELGITVDEADAALTALEKLEIISIKEEKQKKSKVQHSSQYDSEELADAMDGNDSFKEVVDFATDKLQKQLNRNDLNTLFSLHDYYGMPAELICGVLEYCVSIGKRNLSYIFNTAVAMQADGVNSYEALEGYLKAKRSADSKASRFRRLCGWGNRELSNKERTYTDRWFGEMRFSFDLVKYAYEITVNNTGEVALPYMSKVLERWYSKGVKTVDDAKNQEEKKPPQKAEKKMDPEVEELLMAAAKKGHIKPIKED